MRRPLQLAAIALSFVSVAACKHRTAPVDAADAASSAVSSAPSAVASSAPTADWQPPEPPPPAPDRADEVPAAAARLAKDAPYLALWEPKQQAQLREFLSVLSSIVASLGPDGTSLARSFKRLKQWKLDEALNDVVMYVISVGKLPDDFMSSLQQHLAKVKSEPHLGVWQVSAKDGSYFDYSALAAWVNRSDSAYLREHIAANGKDGAARWSRAKQPIRPWLAREEEALRRLMMLHSSAGGSDLTDAEKGRLMTLRTSPLGQEPPEDVELADLLKEYRNNEVRADATYKGKVLEVQGTASDIRKNAANGVYIVVKADGVRGATDLHCRVRSAGANVAALNKGDSVTVRGRVGGLVLTSVMFNDCELEE